MGSVVMTTTEPVITSSSASKGVSYEDIKTYKASNDATDTTTDACDSTSNETLLGTIDSLSMFTDHVNSLLETSGG